VRWPNLQHGLTLVTLVIAGEAVFLLPFVVARVFRPTLLMALGIDNLELGTAFSVYGLVAMLAYLFGGPLADRYPARGLLTAALLSTAAGGLWFARLPSLAALTVLYGGWGLSTILLFWSALIGATRHWGGDQAQGRAYGLLDGGRGLFAAALASVAVAAFAGLLPADDAGEVEVRREAMRAIILAASVATAAAGFLCWWVLPAGLRVGGAQSLDLSGIRAAARRREVWLQAVVVVCAYFAYKVTDLFGLYAYDALGYDDAAAARLGTLTFWTRPIAAVAAGWLADRIGASVALCWGFGLLVGVFLLLGSDLLPLGWPVVLPLTIVTAGLAIYGLRGIYFAVMNETRVPDAITGSAVGLVSVVGFLPDVFAGPLTGWLIDRSPGAVGHRQVFLVTAAFGVVGWIAAWRLVRRAGLTRD